MVSLAVKSIRLPYPLLAILLLISSIPLAAQEDIPAVPRVESVRMSFSQPHEDSQALIWYDDFDQEKQYTESGGPPLDATTNFGNYGKSMRCFYAADSRGSGNRKVFFGDTPYTALARDGEKFDEIYWRIYVKHERGWTGGGPAKMSRATSLVSPNDWSQMMISHVWSSGEALTLDPASGVERGGNRVVTTTYNDFDKLRWLGNNPVSDFKISSTEESGWWVCVEARVKLNTPGESDGENQLWIDGELACERRNLDWRGSYDSHGINAVFLEAYWNDGSPVEQNRWYDNFVVSTERIGPVVCGRNPEVFKMPYEGPGGQAAWELQVASDREGRHIVWRSDPVTDGDSVLVTSDAGTFGGSLAGEGKLAPGTYYYLRVRQQSDSGTWSDWSFWHQQFLTGGEPGDGGLGCDFNGDGRVGVADALALLIHQLRYPGDERGDFDGDGDAGPADVVVLLRDIVDGICGGAPALASSAENLRRTVESADLSADEVERLRETIPLLGLDEDRLAEVEDALRGAAPLPVENSEISLEQNSPNPFNPRTTIRYSLPESAGGSWTSLKVFDLRNRLVRTLVEGFRAAGSYTVHWDGADERNRPVANGIYLYRLRVEETTRTRKMVLLR